jgi:hypothetical protein
MTSFLGSLFGLLVQSQTLALSTGGPRGACTGTDSKNGKNPEIRFLGFGRAGATFVSARACCLNHMPD